MVLGDSFTNIYSRKADMGWGESGGLGSHLAYHLQTRVDQIAANAGGASDCRKQLASLPDPLEWQEGGGLGSSHSDDLSDRNWDIIPIRSKPRAAQPGSRSPERAWS